MVKRVCIYISPFKIFILARPFCLRFYPVPMKSYCPLAGGLWVQLCMKCLLVIHHFTLMIPLPHAERSVCHMPYPHLPFYIHQNIFNIITHNCEKSSLCSILGGYHTLKPLSFSFCQKVKTSILWGNNM